MQQPQQHSAFILDYINGHKKSPWSTAHTACTSERNWGELRKERKCLKMVFSHCRRETREKCAIIVITVCLFIAFWVVFVTLYVILFCFVSFRFVWVCMCQFSQREKKTTESVKSNYTFFLALHSKFFWKSYHGIDQNHGVHTNIVHYTQNLLHSNESAIKKSGFSCA